ncbi:HAMP domain-containing histidine kinase [Clostridium estertheticum]|uniref:HAMP domain-containing sensor histidine kinase n=1 Tax=Clostridium estertheticum TaxID=238834 RepID=UPI001C6F2F3F|nr:HAMP domain-containing sensor histidine kinase [Clostridium estertheticum]MBW9171645.1 HAMP domain-containing histidine kinase [Clostridium estertheticum]WLC77136.1 HAMP domain-containing histidine kinase [Clostridium estertheticum]
MKHEKPQLTKISNIFIKSLLILLIILFIFNMFLIASLFNNARFESNPLGSAEILNQYIELNGSVPVLNDKGKKIASKNNLWIQIVDNNLKEIYEFNKPVDVITKYTPIDFVHAYKYDIKSSTVFICEKKFTKSKYSYFVGFPINVVTKYNIEYSPTKVKSFLTKNIVYLLAANIVIIICFSYFYFAKKIGNPLQNIIDNIDTLVKGNYSTVLKEKGLYKNIFRNLNTLSVTLLENIKEKELLDKLREEWISSIGHDMKTPLSSIKGFSEILMDKDYSFSKKEVKEYTTIIYEKSLYMESLINDLNFSYKLKNDCIVLNLEKTNIVEFTQNIINELLLNPEFILRQINFNSTSPSILLNIDTHLIKRAFFNFIINFLTYNDSSVRLSVDIIGSNDLIKVVIKDNGKGIQKEDIPYIFQRYYRGTNTTTNSKGSGLGMAIASDIIKLHKGYCNIESEISVGTTLTIYLKSHEVIL